MDSERRAREQAAPENAVGPAVGKCRGPLFGEKLINFTDTTTRTSYARRHSGARSAPLWSLKCQRARLTNVLVAFAITVRQLRGLPQPINGWQQVTWWRAVSFSQLTEALPLGTQPRTDLTERGTQKSLQGSI